MNRQIWVLFGLVILSGPLPAQEKPFFVLDSGGHNDSVPSVLFTPDSKQVITVCKDKTACVWDVATGRRHGLSHLGYHRRFKGKGRENRGRGSLSA